MNAPALLGELGPLVTRLARDAAEIECAQRLRYEVFVEEMGAAPETADAAARLDRDPHDDVCDHLLVIDRAAGEAIVGTYRLLPGDRALAGDGFYTAHEFDIAPLLAAHPQARWLELGRSCIHRDYRTKRTMELLWQGTWAYAVAQRTDIMFGCASFPGADVSQHAMPLAWLAENAALPAGEICPGRDARAMPMVTPITTDPRRALAALPPLLKGYLRLGAKVSNVAVPDHAFDTTDVLVVLKVIDISPRYLNHYGADASRFRKPA